MQKPDCLMARMLKRRYFNDTNILNATQKRHASFIWKSLLQGRDLIKRGLRIVVGNGSTVNAWVDPWLPVNLPCPPRARNNPPEIILLSDWIQTPGNSWNEATIREMVIEEDANLIMSIKLCSTATQDMLGWHYTKDGLYSVKSAYWLANQLYLDHTIQPPPRDNAIKAKIWKLDTAPKIKHYIWKFCSGALATGANLRRRHINDQSICHQCCQEEESTTHLFFDCYYAQQVWRASGIPNHAVITASGSMESKLEAILLGNLGKNNLQLFHLALWIL